MLILLYNKFYDFDFERDFNLGHINIPEVQFSQDHSKLAVADAVVFHVPGLLQAREKLPIKYPEQLWVVWSVESEAHYPLINDACFDIKMTYKQNADIWVHYLASYAPTFISDITTAHSNKDSDCLVASFISSTYDKSGRFDYLVELNKHITTHNYGTFLNNRELQTDSGRETKLEVFRRYKFAIAFENSICPDYVTEKFFDPFLTSTVPIYLGAPNVEKYAPGDNSFINVKDFPDPADLADLLYLAASDESLYPGFLAWKNQPISPGFLDLVSKLNSLEPQFFRLAKLVLEHLNYKKNISFRQSDDWQLVQSKDLFYLENIQHKKYHSINRTGAIVWQMLKKNKTLQQLCSSIAIEYSKSIESINSDVYTLITQFYNHDMIHRNWLS